MVDVEFHIRQMPGGAFTDHVFGKMKVRERIECRGPLGTFFLRESDKPAIMLASGTGYAPIRSILLDQFARQSRREFTLYRSEEHTSELQSLMRISYAVFCLKKTTNNKSIDTNTTNKS